MRAWNTTEQAIVEASGATRLARVRVSVKDSGGTFRDLTTWPEFDFVRSATWREDVDGNGLEASISCTLAIENRSLAPLHENSPLNLGFDPAGSYAPLLAVGREIKIEAGVGHDGDAGPAIWREFFRGYIDSLEWPGETVEIEAVDLSAKLRDTWIERERVYALAQGVNATKGCFVFEPSRAYVVGDLVIPTQARLNGHFYKCTTAGTTAATEPTWNTGGGSTTSSGTAVFTEQGSTSTTSTTAVETVIQQICDDNLGAGVVSLSTPVSPSFGLRPWIQKRETVLDAIRRLADLFGWFLRFKWDSGSSTFKLTLWDPNRAKTTADRTFPLSEILTVERLRLEVTEIRNAVRVVYSDKDDRAPGTGYPLRKFVEVTDSTSISKYGRRFMEIAEGDDSRLDTSTEATTLANAVLSDLKEPSAELGIETQFFPWAELGDLYTIKATGRHFTSDQKLALVSVEHTVDSNSARTRLVVRGKPATGLGRWLSKDARNSPADVHLANLYVSGSLPTFEVEPRPVGGVRVSSRISSDRSALEQLFELHVSKSAGFTPSDSTVKASGSHIDSVLSDLEPGETYYAAIVPYSRNAGRIVRGLKSAEQSFTAGRAKAAHYDSTATQSHLPLNGNFEHAIRDLASNPPDHWALSPLVSESESWGSSGSVYYGTDSSKGRYVTLRAHSTQRGSLISSPFEVRRGIRAFNIYLSIRRQTGSGSGSPYDLLVDVFGFSDAALTSQIINYTVTLSGSASGAYPSLNTWYDTVIDFGAGYGSIPTNVNFMQIRLRRSTSGSTAVAWDIGDVYVQEADFAAARIDQTAWSNFTFTSGWGDYSTASFGNGGYVKDSLGWIHLRGVVGRSSGTSTIVATLPSGYRPAKERIFCCWGSDNGSGNPGEVEVTVKSDGTINIADAGGYGYIALDGILFDTN